MTNQILPPCSSGSAVLTERERKMLDSYSRLMLKMCHKYWRVEYAEFEKAIRGKPWKEVLPLKETQNIDLNTMRLIFVLSTDFALMHATQDGKRCPWKGYFGSPGRLTDNPRWRLPSPFYACRHIRKKIQYSSSKGKQQATPTGRPIASGKAGWIARRRAEVAVFTLHHEDIPVRSDSGPECILYLEQSMIRLQERFDSIRDVLDREWLVGGFAGWDVAPKKDGGKLWLNLHLHILGEPYMVGGLKMRCIPPKVKSAWAKSTITSSETKRTGCKGTGNDTRLSQAPEDTLDRLLYVAGVAKVGNEDDRSYYPKFIRGFDKDQVGKKGYKKSGKPQRPTMHQLFMIHGLYMAQPKNMLGFFGGWDHRTRVGRMLRDINGMHTSKLRQNDPALRRIVR